MTLYNIILIKTNIANTIIIVVLYFYKNSDSPEPELNQWPKDNCNNYNPPLCQLSYQEVGDALSISNQLITIIAFGDVSYQEVGDAQSISNQLIAIIAFGDVSYQEVWGITNPSNHDHSYNRSR